MKKTGTKNGLLTTEQTIHDVEHRGFEPLTSSMPWKRATNCANAPNLGIIPDPSPSRLAGRLVEL